MKREIQDFDSPHIIGSRLKGQKQRQMISLRFVIFVVAIVLAVSAIVTGVVLYQPFSFKLKKSEYHMLILSRETTLSAAEAMQKSVSQAGGSGYIVNTGEFLVSAFVYASKKDAESVCERLRENYAGAEVIPYIVGKTKIKRFGDRSLEKTIKNLLNFPIDLIDMVIGYVYSLDSFENTESEVMLQAENLKATLKTKADEAQMFLNNSTVTAPVAAAYAATFYSEIYESFCNVTLISQSEKKLTHRLKNFACEGVFKYYQLRQDLEQL